MLDMPNFNQAATTELIQTTIRNTLRGLVPKELIKESEIDAIVEICMMTVNSTGKEKPRKLMASISDGLLENIIIQFPKLQNTTFDKISSLFVVEWCYRHGHLKSDWYWKWTAPRKGQLFYQSNIPINEIELPSDNQK